jgi:hypothetical protein
LVEVGGAVVAGQFGGEGAEVGELGAGQLVQSEAQQVVGLFGVVHDLLQFVEDVAVQEPEEQPVGA